VVNVTSKNNLKVWIPFLLIVSLPLLSLIWLGWQMTQDERKLLKAEQQEILGERLDLFESSISAFIREKEKALEPLIERLPQNKEALREFVRSQALVTGAFVLNKRGELLFPSPSDGDLSESELRFIVQTREMREARALNAVTRGEGDELKGGAINFNWYPYTLSDGLHLLYYRAGATGEIVGVEVSVVRLLADLIASPGDENHKGKAQGEPYLSFSDSAGTVLYQWGEPSFRNGKPPAEERAAPRPFISWRLSIYSGRAVDAAVGRSSLFNFISGIVLLLAAVFGLSIYFYREQSRELREAAKRVNFVNQVSHELKTPLTNIRLYAELIEGALTEGDERTRGFVGIVVSESQRLGRLIGNILTFANKEKKRLTLSPIPVLIPEVIKDVVEQFGPGLSQRGIVVRLDLKEDHERLADRDALHQILGNLISNVEKYGASGGLLQVFYSSESETVNIVVADNGPGIPQGERAKIFEPFYRISNTLTEGVSGTGIGLSIARDLARLHGGDISLDSTEAGARFLVSLRAPISEKRVGGQA